MKRILMLAIVLLAISVIAPGIVSAMMTRMENDGTFSVTASAPGDIYVLASGMMRQVGAVASGPISSSDPRLTGEVQIALNAIFNTNTGKGFAFGPFTITNAEGIFEGRFIVMDTEYIHFTGRLVGHGTGAYEGLLMKLDMTGTDLYRDADPATNGISATFTGFILSPQGA